MICIIYNPISGNKGTSYREQIEKDLQKIPNCLILRSEYVNHATELTQQAIASNPKKIIVIGGDGTINEVARQLIYSEIPLGIIPMGSGNGLARHLGLSLDFKTALNFALQHQSFQEIDVAYLNDQAFFCTAGIGFDAMVANDFSRRKGRGLLNYIKASFAMNRIYQPIQVKINEEPTFSPFFSITFANANQFGNHAFISPGSNLQDQQFELVCVKPLNFIEKAKLGISLFFKNIHKHPKVTITSQKTCELEVHNCKYYHLDGETFDMEQTSVKIKIVPKSLKIIF